MILFGGDDGIGPSVGSISILDVASMKWTSGNDAPAPEARSEMACSAAGDNFVAWGGTNILSHFETMIVFVTSFFFFDNSIERN